MAEQQPLSREEFEEFRRDDRAWKHRIERKLDRMGDHQHRDHPTWAGFITVLVAVLVPLIGYLVAA